MDSRDVQLHGSRVQVAMAGDGPAVVLLHGTLGSLDTWDQVLPALATDHQVLAPDLRGHGQSTGGPGDYSLGAHASGLRDLLDVLDIDRATVVGHSLGGGIALQFAYQHPERVERLVLESSGGLGPDLAPLLRLASLPGSGWFMPVVCSGATVQVGRWLGSVARAAGLRGGTDLAEGFSAYAVLSDPESRRAFLATLRAVVSPHGQTVSALEKLYLTAPVPTLLIWGGRDPMIPVEHARATHALLPDSRLVVFESVGHFPHRSDPERFAAVLREFLTTTEPAVHDPAARRALLASGGPAEPLNRD